MHSGEHRALGWRPIITYFGDAMHSGEHRALGWRPIITYFGDAMHSGEHKALGWRPIITYFGDAMHSGEHKALGWRPIITYFGDAMYSGEHRALGWRPIITYFGDAMHSGAAGEVLEDVTQPHAVCRPSTASMQRERMPGTTASTDQHLDKHITRLYYTPGPPQGTQRTTPEGDTHVLGWLAEWGFYARSASKAICRARTYNCNLFSPVMMITR